MARLIAIAWLAIPVVLVGQALLGIWRRWRLLARPVAIDARIDEVRASHVERIDDATVVDLVVIYGVDGSNYSHSVTKGDQQKRHYEVGGVFELIYERDNPANVIDASARPWDDVSGPLVFGVLLLIFMTWLLLFVSGLQITG